MKIKMWGNKVDKMKVKMWGNNNFYSDTPTAQP